MQASQVSILTHPSLPQPDVERIADAVKTAGLDPVVLQPPFSAKQFGHELELARAVIANRLDDAEQYDVFADIERGLNNEQIAAKQGRSVLDVESSIAAMERTLGVAGRDGLLSLLLTTPVGN